MLMDDIKLFTKTERDLETLIQSLRQFNQDVGMEFAIEKCTMLVMKSCKQYMTEEIEQPNQEKNRTLGEKETDEYLRILEADTIKQVEKKEKCKKEYLRRTRKLLETKLYGKSLNKGINTSAVPIVRYSWLFLKRTSEELKQMEQRTRKRMTMNKTLHPRDNGDRLYVPRREERIVLASIEDSVDTSIQRHEDNIEKPEARLITVTRNNSNDTRTSWLDITRKQKWQERQL